MTILDSYKPIGTELCCQYVIIHEVARNYIRVASFKLEIKSIDMNFEMK